MTQNMTTRTRLSLVLSIFGLLMMLSANAQQEADAYAGVTEIVYLRRPGEKAPQVRGLVQRLQRKLLGDRFFERVLMVGFDRDVHRLPLDDVVALGAVEHLIIRGRPLTAKEVEAVVQMKQLQVLDLFGCTLSVELYQQLEQELPRCTLLTDPDLFAEPPVWQ